MATPGIKEEFIQLVRKLFLGKASSKEKKFLEKYYQYFDKEQRISSTLSPNEKEQLELKILHQINVEIDRTGNSPIIPFYKRPLFRAAAVILVIISVGIYIWYNNSVSKAKILAKSTGDHYQNDVQPGGNRAMLTLSNGSTIVLDSVRNGLVAQQGRSRILKVNSGQLSYNTDNIKQDEVLYNTITTPRGGQYQIELSDGTKVWLNAASSLKFPTAFTDKDREVILTGEAYFEVVRNKAHPFKVRIGEVQVEDLGTHFNVMAYNDEAAIKTTLLEGAAKVSQGNKDAFLEPGQQAIVDKNAASAIEVKKVYMNEAVAWKNGEFSFNNTDIHNIMRQISRWYDVDVTFVDSLNVFLNGNINRNVEMSQVSKMLELTGELQIQISGREVTVMK